MQHAIKNYFRCVLSAYIDSQERYVLPDVKEGDLEPLITEALAVKSVDLHCYGTEGIKTEVVDAEINTEVVVILFGSSLWFTRELCIHSIQDLYVYLQANTAHEVQARIIIPRDVASFIKELPHRGTVHVGSCFLSASTHDVEIHAKVCFGSGHRACCLMYTGH